MADNVQLNQPDTPGAIIATDNIAGVQHQLVKVEFGVNGVATLVTAASPLPVTGTINTGLVQSLTDAQLRASPVPVSTGLLQGVTDAQLRASAVSVDTGLVQSLTDVQLRATPVPVDTGLLQGLTDAELRAMEVIVKGTVTQNAQSFSLDAGSRLRVSSLTTLGDYKILGADETLLMQTVGTGTGLFTNNTYTMTVASGEWLVRKSRKHHPYLSGKSQQVELTLIGFEGTVSVVVQNFGTDVFRVSQNDWNVNPLAGHDWSTFNVIIFDFLWLGGAMLRTFVVTAEGILLVDMRNVASSVAGLIFRSPNQPVRYEIRSDGVNTTKRVGYFSSNGVTPYDSNKDGVWLESVSASPTGAMTYVCAQVSTEGSIDESGKIRSVNTGSALINLAVVGTTYPLKAIRFGTGFRDKYVKATGLSAFVNTNNDILLVSLQLNPTLSAPLTYTPVSNSSAEEANGDGTITVTVEGTVLFSQVINVSSVFSPSNFLQDFLTVLGSDIDNVSDQLVLCGTPVTTTVGSFGTINFKEY